jgi:hypothetical protein
VAVRRHHPPTAFGNGHTPQPLAVFGPAKPINRRPRAPFLLAIFADGTRLHVIGVLSQRYPRSQGGAAATILSVVSSVAAGSVS